MDMSALHAAKLKYRRLVTEIEALPGGRERDNLLHTAFKLGSFFEEAVGTRNWRAAERDMNVVLRELDDETR